MRSARSVKATRFATLFAIAALALPAAVGPTAAADPVIYTAGTTQDFDSSNPYQTALVSGYEAFQLSFDLLVGFGLDTKPIPGFADKWTRNPDNVTFHIRTGMKWSDGEPATSADACFSWQLALDAHAAKANIGLGYLDTGVSDAGVTKLSCPDPETMIAYTTDQSDRIYQVYLPIVPKHIYGKDTYKTIGDEPFNGPLVGTGPYQLAEWKTGQFMRFTRNKNYWGTQGFEDEVVLQIFSSSDTMVQALKAGDLQYAHGVNAEQLNALKTTPNIQTVVGAANGWSQLAFNEYGVGTGKTIPGGGPSTKALLDPKFRDALGYAVDKKLLLDRVLGGYGDVGSTIVPPVLGDMHVEPDAPRTFDISLAKQKLDSAGYPLDASGKRLDKEGKPIVLRLVMPDSDANYPKAAQFIKDWYGQLGIEVQANVYDSNTLTDLLLPPEGGGKTNLAKYDIELWGWAGNPDPNGLLDVFKCDEIGSLSDSNFCDPAYDALYTQESALGGDARKAVLKTMQNMIYGLAVYDILYYDSNLDAYRTDKFTGLQNMPANGVPLFSYGTFNYTQIKDATAVPTPGPSSNASTAPGTSSAPATPAPSATPGDTSSGGSNTTLLIVLLVVVIVVVAVAWWYRGRRKAAAADEEG
ncbi:MAG: peptide/nickel transport system substrate-binding protein [Chloroflexota bacterium]|jgi:peptide/nickel transport system substrate-binding protein|nr:peptide/nickel transport system substrate-binding protein [Chloroflexota bacterium]